MSTLNPNKAEDRSILMDFYQLKTLSPKDYQSDTVHAFKLDLSHEDLTKIPKEVVNHLLGDNMNDLNNSIAKDRPNSVKKHVLSTGKSNYSDALGFHQNILDELIDKDILDDTRDPQLNKFMVDSKLFNPKLFLSVIHSDKSLNELITGIKYLENDINAKKPLLQQLITNNFEKTLNCKNSLDKVFNEFSSSNLGDEINVLNKNLASSSNSANQLLNPVLLLISKEQELTNALSFIKSHKFFLDLPKKLKSYIDEDDFDSVLKEYERGFVFFQQLKSSQNKNPLFDKIWSTVKKVIDDYKSSMLEDLKKIHIDLISSNFKSQIHSKKKNFVILIKRIIELTPTENPIKDFIFFQYKYILEDLDKGLATIDYDRLFNARNSILNAYNIDKENPNQHANLKENLLNTTLLRMFTILGSSNFNADQINPVFERMDSPLIIQLWNFVFDYCSDVTEQVIGKKILRFESIVEFFLNDFNDLLSKNAKENSAFQMDKNDLAEMRKYFVSMITKICGRLDFVFSCTTNDLTNALQMGVAEGPNVNFPTVGEKNLDDPSTFGYIPPNSNSISTIYYSANLYKLISKKLLEIVDKNFVLSSKDTNNQIQSTIISINRNIIKGCFSTLTTDISRITLIDKMVPNDTVEGGSKLVTFCQNYYKLFISKIHELYVFEDLELKKEFENHFLKSFNVLVNGMIKNLSKQVKSDPEKLDYYYLTTLYNLRYLKSRVIPSILKSFDLNFQTNLYQKKDLTIFKTLDEYESSLFTEYMKDPIATVTDIIRDGLTNLNFNSEGILTDLAGGKTINASGYVLNVVNYINTLKSRLINFNIRKSFLLDVQTALINLLQYKIIDNLNMEFTKDSIYQLALDTKIFIKLIKNYNKKCVDVNIIDTKGLEGVFKNIEGKVDISSIAKDTEANITYNYTQFMCFVGE
jgi:hypothetical protein